MLLLLQLPPSRALDLGLLGVSLGPESGGAAGTQQGGKSLIFTMLSGRICMEGLRSPLGRHVMI